MPCVAIILLALATASAALAASGDPAPGFGEVIDVRVVEVEAVVTRGGERVRDLAAEDFRLLVDDEEVPIEFFSEVRGGLAAEDSVGELAAGTPVTTRYLIFIDDDFTVPSRRNSVLRRLEKDLSKLGAHDRVALVAWDGRRVELLAGWMPKGPALARAFRLAEDRPAYGLQRRSEWGRLQSELRYQSRPLSGGSSFSSIGFSGASRAEARSTPRGSTLKARVGRLSWALTSALRGFAGSDGRKVVLFLGGGLPPVDGRGPAGADVTSRYDSDRLDRFARGAEARRFFAPAVDAANRLGYTLYPVDLGGIGSPLAGADVGSLAEARWRRRQARDDEELSEDALHYMAEATGGLALLDGARFGALGQIVEDTRSYYRLGFSPAWREDDRHHEVRVELRQGRADVRARTGFSDLSRGARLAMVVESAHLFDLPLPAERRFALEVGAVENLSRGRMRVPLTLRLPTASFTFLAAESGETARVELRIAASDDRGNAADMPIVEIEIRRDQLEAGVFTWHTSLELRRRAHRLLLAVHDPLSDTVLARRLEIDPS